jgi:hypothetical protein
MRVTWRSLELYIPIPIMQAAIGRCQGALDGWYEKRGTVVQFPVAAE